jgi:hypothetical protein
VVFNATFNNSLVISWWSVLLVEEVSDKLYHIMLYRVHLAMNMVAVMVSNSNNIKENNNYLSSQIIEHTQKGHDILR